MARVNRYPVGFLDVLGAVTQGKTPPEFSEVLAGVVDMTDYYLTDLLAGYEISAAHSATGTAFTFNHDPAEVWLLRGISVTSSNLPAGAFERWSAAVGSLPRSAVGSAAPDIAVKFWSSDTETNTNVGDDLVLAHTFAKPFIVPPDVNIVVSIDQRDGGVARSSAVQLLLSILQR